MLVARYFGLIVVAACTLAFLLFASGLIYV
jgi:hypothetical protein